MRMCEKKAPINFYTRISIAILAVLLIVLAAFPVASADEWSYRKPITINGSQVQGTVTNFPVLINLSSDSDLATSAQDDGGDIVFTNAVNTVRYDHEIEKFVKSTGELVAWVEIDSLSSGSNTTIYMWYGNSDCADQWNIEETWDSNYKLVQHLKESCASSGCIKDSTSNNNDGTPYSGGNITDLYTPSGNMNGADNFDGSDDYVDIGDFDSNNGGNTFEFWLNSDIISANHDFFSKYVSGSTNGEWNFRLNNDGKVHFWYMPGGNTFKASQAIDTNWHHVAFVYTWGTGSSAKFYIDGVEDTGASWISGNGNNAWANSNIDTRIGSAPHGKFDGTIDEVRISATARNAAWIKTSYNNQNDPSTFYTVGGQEDASPVQPVPDLPAIILFGAGLLVIVLYAVRRRCSRR